MTISVGQAHADLCDGQGNAVLVLDAETPGIGERVSFTLHGKRLARLSVLADVGAGPTVVPGIGTLCLDLGPELRIVLDGIRNGAPRIRAGGFYQFEIRVPNRQNLLGRTFYVQAAIEDDDAPNGIALSNMIPVYLHAKVEEDFTSTDFRAGTTTANWADGFCNGVLPQRTVTATPGPQTVFRLGHPLIAGNDPLTPNGCRFQMRFRTDEVGAVPGEYLVGMNWMPRSGYTFASTYTNLSITLADFNGTNTTPMSRTYSSNYQSAPQTVFQGTYEVPNGLNQVWFPWPEFTTPYEMGTRPLLFEVDLPVGGTTFQLLRNRSVAIPHNRNLANSGGTRAVNNLEGTTYYSQFHLVSRESMAESLFYDSGVELADYGEPVVEADVPEGTSMQIRFRGGRDTDGDDVPDETSDWVDDIDEIDGYRFVKFRIEFVGDMSTGATPTVTRIELGVVSL